MSYTTEQLLVLATRFEKAAMASLVKTANIRDSKITK